MKIDKVYTRSGDKGETSLVGGQRVRKDSIRIEAYGTVDELNAIIGLLRSAVDQSGASKLQQELFSELQRIQQNLFNLGSELACPDGKLLEGMPCVSEDSISQLEAVMDRWSDGLEPLHSFILPGGGPMTAWSHLARTVCRRAERIVVTLCREETGIRHETVRYLNRLSDWFFVLSRHATKQGGETEILWDKKIQ